MPTEENNSGATSTRDAQDTPNDVDERANRMLDLENLFQDWVGVQENEYLKYLARSQVPAHILMSFTNEQLNRWIASLQQLDTRGACPQVFDLIHKSLHLPLTMLSSTHHLDNPGIFMPLPSSGTSSMV